MCPNRVLFDKVTFGFAHQWEAHCHRQGSVVSSNFSLNGGSAQHSNDVGSLDLDMAVPDSGPSLQSDSSSTPQGLANHREREREVTETLLFSIQACLDVLDPSLLTIRAHSQRKAVAFLILWHTGNLDELAKGGRDVGMATDKDCMVQNAGAWETLRGILVADVSK